MKWTLAAKNLRRDRRRSALTVLSVTLGLSAILLFLAYVRFVEDTLSRLVIYQDGNAHVQVYRQGGPENLAAFPARFSLSPADRGVIAQAVALATPRARGGVVRQAAQLFGVGTINHAQYATIFLARGVDPQADAALRADGGFIDASEASLAPAQPDGVLLTRQVGDLLGLSGADPHANLQLSGATYGNRFNAIEVTPAGAFTTGIEAIEDKSIKLPLATLQGLYDTDDVSRVVVQLGDRADCAAFAAALQGELEQVAKGRYTVTQWDSPQVDQLYRSFMGFANTMFMFTGIVLLLIVVATVQHTIAGNVNDRLKEIGMLRALGFGRRAVTGIFVRESVLLAAAGCLLALVLCALVFHVLPLHIETALPRLSAKVRVTLALPGAVAVAIAVAAAAAIACAAWLTVRRVVRGATARPGPFALARLVAASSACWLVVALLPGPGARAATAAGAPDPATMQDWLRRADAARGGFAAYSWTAQVHSVEPAGTSDTRYAVAVSDGRALVRTEAPARQAGEKILLDGRAMWYGKRGLRKPVSISAQQRLSGEASNGDIASVQYARDYVPVFAGEETIDGHDCYVLTLTARHPQVAYETIQYYLDRKSLLGVKADFKTAAGMPLKTAYFEYNNKVMLHGGSAPFVSRMKIVNASFPDRVSDIEYSGIAVAQHPEALFRIDNLLTP